MVSVHGLPPLILTAHFQLDGTTFARGCGNILLSKSTSALPPEVVLSVDFFDLSAPAHVWLDLATMLDL
jgi:hypothetical protein